MALPEPHPGLVVCYSYLWAREHGDGREEGSKNRPCAIVLARRVIDEHVLVTVVAVTHSPPARPDEAVEIPPAVKRLLGLDDERSWIVVSEVNDFLWPGPDLARIPGSDPPRFDYGVLPPGFFQKVRNQLLALAEARRVSKVPRSE
jgi:hypothetical protein